MPRYFLFLLSFLFVLTDCSRKATINIRNIEQIPGCWKGKQIARFDRPFSEQIFFTLRPDSSLTLSTIYELGPRSRVWMPDGDVDINGNTIQWDKHTGSINEARDSMNITFDEEGGRTTWLYVRDRSADSLMSRLWQYTSPSYVYRTPEECNDGWQCADIDTSNIDTSKIFTFLREIHDGEHDDIHSVLIIKDNRLVVDEYFATNGKKYGPFITGLFRDKAHHLASTTKAITSTLVGVAIDKGFIQSVDDPIYKYLPAYASLFSEEKKQIKIRDMLTMTPGFEWRQLNVSDDRNDGMRMWQTNDVIGYVLRKPLEAEPGKKFNYTNGVPTVTGAILKNATGRDVRVFAEEYLFNPLQISEYLWTSYPDGSIETDGGLALRSRDLAKIGQLFLNNGSWNNTQILSPQWVHESTAERLRFGKSNRWGYGYHWTRAETRIGEGTVFSYFVPGDGNQILAVFPDRTMVVVITAGNYGKDPKPVYYSIFEEFILPAVIHNY